jgi:hypothetical protein
MNLGSFGEQPCNSKDHSPFSESTESTLLALWNPGSFAVRDMLLNCPKQVTIRADVSAVQKQEVSGRKENGATILGTLAETFQNPYTN